MSKVNRKQYSRELKFRIVLEIVSGKKPIGEIAKAFNIHPITLYQWKREFLEKGPEIFGGSNQYKVFEKRIRELERLVGQKEVELALLKNFLTES
jgi:transposase-like protein